MAKYFLEDELHKNVDLGYFNSMRSIIQKHIQSEMIHV